MGCCQCGWSIPRGLSTTRVPRSTDPDNKISSPAERSPYATDPAGSQGTGAEDDGRDKGSLPKVSANITSCEPVL